MNNKKERRKVLKERRDALVKKYKEHMMFLSSIEDQIADIDGDIRMLENGQKEESS